MTENLIETPIAIPTHREKGILRQARRYLRPVLGALLLAQALTLPTPSLAEGNNPDNQALQEYLVDVIIHHSLPQQETEDWARDAVDNYLNRRFAESGTSKRFRTDQIIRDYDEATGCSIPGAIPVYDRCEFNDGKIRVWLYQQGFRYRGILAGTSADPISAAVQKELPSTISVEQDGYFGQRVHGDALLHEVGHLFGIPDYYHEDVPAGSNQVAPVGIIPFARDVMHNNNQHNHFSDTSRHYIERVNQLPIGFGEPHWDVQFTPKQTTLNITNDEGLPLSGVEIEVFPQKMTVSEIAFNGRRPIQMSIPNTPSFTKLTDELGQVDLGSYYDLFHSNGQPLDPGSGPSAFLRISHNDEVRYAAITRSYLNYLYFQGYEDVALVSLPFSSLLMLEEGKNLYLSAPGVFVEF